MIRTAAATLAAFMLAIPAHSAGVSFSGAGHGANQDAPTVFRAVDSEPDGDFDDADVEAALTACDSAAPANGCRIELVWGETYTDAQIEVGEHVRYFRGFDEATTLLGPTDANDEPIVLREPRDGGWATRFTHFKVDGQKQNLTAGGAQHNCIEVGDATSNQLAGGYIRKVVCENVTSHGFQIEDAPNWTFADSTIRYIGCYDGPNADGGPLADWTPNSIDGGLMECGTWDDAFSDDDTQPGRKWPGIGIEVQRNSHNAVITGNLVEYYTKIAIQGIDSSMADESSYPTNGLVQGNTVQWGLSGISLVRSNEWTVDANFIYDIGAPWQVGNVGAGTACAFAGRGSQFTNNTIERTNGSGMGVSCDCGATIGGGFECNVVVTGNSITDACETDTTFGTIFANTLGTLGDADGITITGNTIVSSSCGTDLNIDGYINVTEDVSSVASGCELPATLPCELGA